MVSAPGPFEWAEPFSCRWSERPRFLAQFGVTDADLSAWVAVVKELSRRPHVPEVEVLSEDSDLSEFQR